MQGTFSVKFIQLYSELLMYHRQCRVVLMLILKQWNTLSISALCNILGVIAILHGIIETPFNNGINTVATH